MSKRSQLLRGIPGCLVLALGLLSQSCALTGLRTITFRTDGQGTVSLVNWETLETNGEILGTTPVTVELDRIGENIVKITGPGKAPQFWVFEKMLGENLNARLVLTDVPVRTSNEDVQALDPNESHRLLMKEYKALAEGDLTLAKDLSAQHMTMQPKLAAPLIINGLACLQEGDKARAHTAFTKAKGLDPADKDIDKLIEATQ